MEQVQILIVDPDEANRNFLTQMLKKKNYSVMHATTGREAVEIAVQKQPNLVVFETHLPDLTFNELIQQLGQNPRSAQIPLVVLTSHSDPEEMQACLQAGCSEYYVKSGMVMMTLVDSIPRLLVQRRAIQAQAQEGLLIAFLSAKGGTGTSSLCANIGMNIAQHIIQSKVAVLDLVLPIGSIAKIVGYNGDLDIVKVSERPIENITPEYFRDNLVIPQRWAIHLLPGAASPREANQLHVDRLPNIIDAMRKEYGYVLVDLGRALSKISMPIIKQADLVCLIVSTDVSSVTLTKTVWDFLKEEGIEASRMFPILNRAVGMEGLTKAEAEKIIGLDIKLMMPYMMGNFTLANNLNTPISLKFPTDTASMVLKEAAIEMSRQAIKLHSQ